MFEKLKNRLSKNQLKYGAMLSYAQMALSVIIGLFYTPYMIRMLGKNEYGLYSTVSSTISMLTILNLGLNAGYIRYFAKYRVEKDDEAISRLNGLYFIIFSILGFLVLNCGLGISFNLNWIFNDGLTVKEYEIAKVLGILTSFNLSISFLTTVFSTIISAHEKYVVLKSLAMIKTAFTPAIMLPILYCGYKSIAMVTVTVILSLFVDICYFIYCRKILFIKFRFEGLNKDFLKSLFVYTFFIALNSIFDQLSWNADKCVLARFNGTADVAVYSVAYTFVMFFMSISSSISGVFTPKIHTLITIEKNNPETLSKKLTDLFIKIGRIQFLIIALIISGFYLFGFQFMNFWVGQGYGDSYFVILIFMISLFTPLIQNLGIEIQRALNKHQFRSIIYVITAIGHLILSIIICQKYGAIGCAIGNAISMIIGPGIIINIFYYKKCFINIFLFWQNILRMSLGLILPIGIMVLVKEQVQLNVVPNFLCCIIVYIIFYFISMWFISMNEYEKSLVLSFFKKKS